MNIRRAIAISAVAGLLLATAEPQPKPRMNVTISSPSSVDATIDDFAFTPKELTVEGECASVCDPGRVKPGARGSAQGAPRHGSLLLVASGRWKDIQFIGNKFRPGTF